MNRNDRRTILLVFFIIIAFFAECAYIDPGTGSYFISILIGVLAGGAFALKMFWKKIAAFFRGEHRKKAEPGADKHD